MDQVKIGEFICRMRKKKNITQSELAEMLNITDRSISKWENGVCLPDASNMVLLCKILDISINDLFSGEIVDMKDNEKRLEENLLNLKRDNEEKDKRLLNLEILISVPVVIIGLSLMLIAAYASISDFIKVILIVLGFILIFSICFIALRIEQTAGYYECNKCHHKYVPTYQSVLWSIHFGRTRYMKCPKCNKRSWNKKVVSK